MRACPRLLVPGLAKRSLDEAKRFAQLGEPQIIEFLMRKDITADSRGFKLCRKTPSEALQNRTNSSISPTRIQSHPVRPCPMPILVASLHHLSPTRLWTPTAAHTPVSTAPYLLIYPPTTRRSNEPALQDGGIRTDLGQFSAEVSGISIVTFFLDLGSNLTAESTL